MPPSQTVTITGTWNKDAHPCNDLNTSSIYYTKYELNSLGYANVTRCLQSAPGDTMSFYSESNVKDTQVRQKERWEEDNKTTWTFLPGPFMEMELKHLYSLNDADWVKFTANNRDTKLDYNRSTIEATATISWGPQGLTEVPPALADSQPERCCAAPKPSEPPVKVKPASQMQDEHTEAQDSDEEGSNFTSKYQTSGDELQETVDSMGD